MLVLLLGFAELAAGRLADMGLLSGSATLNYALLIGFPALTIGAQLLNEWAAERNRRKARVLAIKPARVPAQYFRIGPYLDTDKDRHDFRRADQAHEKALVWLRQSAATPLYLSGDSGSGKTSLLNAFVVPMLRKDGWTVAVERAGQDADAALRKAATTDPRPDEAATRALLAAAAGRQRRGLLVVLEQFEEFLIQATPEQRGAFASAVSDLAQRPIPGLKLLLSLRTEYRPVLEEIGLPRLNPNENLFQVSRFTEEAARTFFRNSKLGLTDEPLDRLLRSAANLDGTPGLIRPITLNVLGFMLQARGGAVARSLDAGILVRGYIEQAVENPVIREWAPLVLERMVSEQGEKLARSEGGLVYDTKLRIGEVRAVLLALSDAALARPLPPSQDRWELSHDFVARAISRYLGRRRAAPLRRAGAYAAPVLLALGIFAGAATVEWQRLAPAQMRAQLADLGISIESHSADGLYAAATGSFNPDKLATIAPLLKTLSVVRLDLANTKVSDLEPLKGLTALQALNLANTPVSNLEPLQGLAALQSLDLENTQTPELEVEQLQRYRRQSGLPSVDVRIAR